MYRLKTKNTKTDPVARWNFPDRAFFACGACHILAYAFSEKYPDSGFLPIWIKPAAEFDGNHIVMVQGNIVFDYHGYSSWPNYFNRYKNKARRYSRNWNATLHQLQIDVLISESKSREHEGLWLREPGQFLHNALPRAEKYLEKFASPHSYITSIKQELPTRNFYSLY